MKSAVLLNGFPGSLGSQTVAAWTVLAFLAITGAANKKETISAAPTSPIFIMGRSPFAVSLALSSQRSADSAPAQTNVVAVVFQFVAQPAQIAVMVGPTQVGAVGFSFPVIAGRQPE